MFLSEAASENPGLKNERDKGIDIIWRSVYH